MKSVFFICTVLLFVVLASCNPQIVNNNNIIAYVDTIPISLTEIDSKIKQNLYDELSRIYLLRQTAINNEIEKKVLEIESKKNGIPRDSVLSRYLKNKLNLGKITEFNKQYKVKYGKVLEIRNGLIYHDPDSPRGKELILEDLKKEMKSQFIDSLKNENKITINLKPPVAPTINLEHLLVHCRGDEGSSVSMIIISDFDCDRCREYHSLFDSIYNNYSHLVKFGFTNYSSYVSESAIAAESASLQNKFWEMHDALMKISNVPDSTEIFDIANNLGLNMTKFKRDYSSDKIYNLIEANLYMINGAGIYGTPTILIDNKPVFNSSSIEDIINRLEEELTKSM
ncbi:MAG: thioredoxin domain-containing protein [Bacteroidales bacterium]|nr:thioredoxin domain-containing protein [Bacteroidales bacterium]